VGHDVEWYDAECALHFLEVFVSHFTVVSGWVLLGKIIRKVEFSRGPDEVELALLDSVFHPPVAHVERLGKFLAHFGIEDALSSAVVGFERGLVDGCLWPSSSRAARMGQACFPPMQMVPVSA
jgi:hypothetical protein